MNFPHPLSPFRTIAGYAERLLLRKNLYKDLRLAYGSDIKHLFTFAVREVNGLPTDKSNLHRILFYARAAIKKMEPYLEDSVYKDLSMRRRQTVRAWTELRRSAIDAYQDLQRCEYESWRHMFQIARNFPRLSTVDHANIRAKIRRIREAEDKLNFTLADMTTEIHNQARPHLKSDNVLLFLMTGLESRLKVFNAPNTGVPLRLTSNPLAPPRDRASHPTPRS